MSETLILIPARKGSKRLPGKNTRLFAGQPLIAWSIQAALQSGVEADVVVSTDCEIIAGLSKQHGASVPFLRPEELATDQARGFDVIEHALATLKKQGRQYRYVIMLQPTSPLRQPWHIKDALAQVQSEPQVRSMVSVTEITHPVEWTMTLPDDNSMDGFISDQLPRLQSRSQELALRYRINGAIYVARETDLLDEKTFYMLHGTRAYKMEKQYSVDIDDIDDFQYAESLMLKSITG